MMIRVAIIGTDGKVVSPMNLPTASDLRDAATLAKALALDCEKLAAIKEPKVAVESHRGMPYVT